MVRVYRDVAYGVDSADRLVFVNDAWSEFARDNAGEALLPPAVLGRSLWDFITDGTTLLLYRDLIARVRRANEVVRFGFRCDAPAQRRLLEMRIAQGANGGVVFTVAMLDAQDRPAQPFLSAGVEREDGLLRICGWCKRIPMPSGAWVEVEEAITTLGLFGRPTLPRLSHGICERCAAAMLSAADSPTTGEELVVVGAFDR